ncbi:periplasmic immunogenic protein [Streptomyces sp. CNQ-509]|uniref:SIMPL domain-containing protein n=1 Tax=unclassified Streptomyces TaxID=2593676 RepID=UPI00062DFA60|nr:SIMPL domain-containing protein [Streptomyces sp. CNQ-509]AKH81834.1 periplasmic immunogenic protein [Streptomyces sp. CNQ-509]
MTNPPPASAPAPHGTPDQPRLAVRGEARLEVDPEIARIAVTVAVRGTDRRTALEDLTRRNAEARDLIRSYGDAVEKLETGALLVTPELGRHGRGERVRRYHGRVRLAATFSDFTALGELSTRAADLELTSVEGPWWALRPDSPVHREARQQAVREAVTRAREYAEAVGAELTAVLEIADEGAERQEAWLATEATRGYGGPAVPGGEAAPALDLEPQRQTVYARVNARFTMSRPQL